MAAIKQPLQDMLARLKGLTKEDTSLLFASVFVYNNQIEQLEAGTVEAIPLPAAFVEIQSPIEWQPIGGGLQQADLVWKIHVVMEQLDAQDGNMEQNLDIFDIRDQVVVGLSGYKPMACGMLFRSGEEPDYKHTNLYHEVVSFKCGFIDSKGSPYDPSAGRYIYKQPPTDLEVDLSKSVDPVADNIEGEFKGEYIIKE